MAKKNINKEIIIKTTLQLIEEKHGLKDVNLREIAKKIGCAHTNLYNYFDSLDEIFWESLANVLIKMINYSASNLDSINNSEEKFYLLLKNILDFSIDHQGWYRLIWLEKINGSPSPEVNKILNTPSNEFNEGLIQMNNNRISKEKADLIGNILMTYMHGEICKWINNRITKSDVNETKVKILENLKYLYKLLINGEEI